MDVSLKLYVDTDYISLGGYALYAVSWTGVTCYGLDGLREIVTSNIYLH